MAPPGQQPAIRASAGRGRVGRMVSAVPGRVQGPAHRTPSQSVRVPFAHAEQRSTFRHLRPTGPTLRASLRDRANPFALRAPRLFVRSSDDRAVRQSTMAPWAMSRGVYELIVTNVNGSAQLLFIDGFWIQIDTPPQAMLAQAPSWPDPRMVEQGIAPLDASRAVAHGVPIELGIAARKDDAARVVYGVRPTAVKSLDHRADGVKYPESFGVKHSESLRGSSLASRGNPAIASDWWLDWIASVTLFPRNDDVGQFHTVQPQIPERAASRTALVSEEASQYHASQQRMTRSRHNTGVTFGVTEALVDAAVLPLSMMSVLPTAPKAARAPVAFLAPSVTSSPWMFAPNEMPTGQPAMPVPAAVLGASSQVVMPLPHGRQASVVPETTAAFLAREIMTRIARPTVARDDDLPRIDRRSAALIDAPTESGDAGHEGHGEGGAQHHEESRDEA